MADVALAMGLLTQVEEGIEALGDDTPTFIYVT